MKFGKKFGGPFRQTFGGLKHEISARFRTTLRLDREYLRNATTRRQSENGVANYTDTHAQANLIWCTLVHKRLK